MAAQLSLARCSSRVISSRQVVAPRRLSAAPGAPRTRQAIARSAVTEVEAANSSKHGEQGRQQRRQGQCARLQGSGAGAAPAAPSPLLGRRIDPARMPLACVCPAEKKHKKEEEEEEWDGHEDDGLNPQQASASGGGDASGADGQVAPLDRPSCLNMGWQLPWLRARCP